MCRSWRKKSVARHDLRWLPRHARFSRAGVFVHSARRERCEQRLRRGPLAALVLRSSELNTPHHVLYAVPSELVSLEPLWTSVMPVSVWPRTSVTSS